MATLRTTFGSAMLWLDDTARNSNLLPVKANGLVRLRSPASRGSFGSTATPISIIPPLLVVLALPAFSTCWKMSVSWSPRKIEMIAGGASFAPRRWSLPALAMLKRSRPWNLLTARITAAQKTRNWMFSCGVSPGLSRLLPTSSDMLQFKCLPEPFTPANGFSCIRHARPYFGAIRRNISIVIIW